MRPGMGGTGFPLAQVMFRALNSNMDEEVRITPAEVAGARVNSGAVLRKGWRRPLMFGAIAGMAVGVLNVLAVRCGWKLADYFDLLDFLFLSLGDSRQDPFGPFHLIGWRNVDSDFYGPGMLCGIMCYWTFIGLFAGALFCLVRDGVILEVVREKIGRWMLFLGTCGGIFVGCLNFLTASNGWLELEGIFDYLERPINWLIFGLEVRFDFSIHLPEDPRARFVYTHVALIVYWAVIGLVVAWLVGAAWIVRKRIAAGNDKQPSGNG